MTLGQRIRSARDERGLTLRAAADELGCSAQQLRLWELNAATPEPKRLERVRQWLDLDAATLLRELSKELTGAYLARAS